MKARHSLLTGISGMTGVGLSLLACGCAPGTTADERPTRQRFEVTPGVSPRRTDRGTVVSRPARPQSQVAQAEPADGAEGAAEDASAEEARPAAPHPTSPEAVRRRVAAHTDTVRSAQSKVAAAGDGSVRWNAPEGQGPAPAGAATPAAESEAGRTARAAVSPAPAAATPVAPAAAPKVAVKEKAVEVSAAPEEAPVGAAAFEATSPVANAPTQIAKPPAPAPPPPPTLGAGQVLSRDQGPFEASISTDTDPLFHKFQQRIREYPSDLSAHLDYQMLRLLRDEPAPQVMDMGRLSAEDRELLTGLMDGMSNFRNALRADKNMLPSQKIKPLQDMVDRLRGSAELTIPTIAACSKVQGFGVYEPISSNLKAGADNPLILYCEVQNFSSQQNEKGMWETKLSQEAVLYTETGLGVWKDKSDIPVDLSRNRRHDFFVVKKIILPRTLAVGRYVLKVTVVDEQVKRVAENSIPLQVLAQ